LLASVVGYLAKKLEEDKSVKSFFSEFTEATVAWLRPIFLVDEETPKEAINDLGKAPSEKLNQDAVAISIAKALKADPALEGNLKAVYDALQEKKESGESITISNSSNVNTGNIQAGGNVIVGKDNQIKG
jgi:hypothetical protein